MKRLLIPLTVLVALAVLAAPAVAKEQGVDVSSTPAGIGPGQPWTPEIRVLADPEALSAGSPPTLVIRNAKSGKTINFPATPTGEPGTYDVRVVFPDAGTWSYEVIGGIDGRIYPYPAVTIGAPVAAESPVQATQAEPIPTAESGSFPAGPVAGGLAGLTLLGFALLARGRMRRVAS